MLYRVGGRILDGRSRERRFVCVEAASGDAAAEAAQAELRRDAGCFAVIIEDVRPAPADEVLAAAAASRPKARKGKAA